MPPGTSRTEGRALSNCATLAPRKLKLPTTNLFSRRPVITFTSGRIPCLMMSLATFGVQLTWRHKKTSHHIDKQQQFTTANSHQGRLPKVRIANQTVGLSWKRYRPSFELSPENQHCCAQNLKIDYSGWADLIDAGIFISSGLQAGLAGQFSRKAH